MEQHELMRVIDEMKGKLYQSYIQNGLNSIDTIRISQELDVLLSHVQRAAR